MELTKQEVEQDLEASKRDIEYLELITDNMVKFINNPCGENRKFLTIDTFKYGNMLNQAKRLHIKIEEAYSKFK